MKLLVTIVLLSFGMSLAKNVRHRRAKANGNTDWNANVPFEAHPGSCRNTTIAWASFPDAIKDEFSGDFATFDSECGENASLFSSEGCCRYHNGLSVEIDSDREFPASICVCNQWTSTAIVLEPKASTPAPVPAPTVSPAPTTSPTPLVNNCDSVVQNMYVQFGYTACHHNTDCPNTNCCTKHWCVCWDTSFDSVVGSNMVCVGDN